MPNRATGGPPSTPKQRSLAKTAPTSWLCWLMFLSMMAVPGAQAQVSAATSSAQTWAPPDIDQVVPPVSPEVSCPLGEVLAGASTRVKELFENLQQFSANERVEHVELDKRGNPRSPKSATFTYVAQIHQVSPGQLDVDEYRNGSTSQPFPNLVTSGTVAHALIFHPDVIGDYTVTCEGLGTERGQPAWQLHFVQRPDRPPRFRQYRTSKGWFNVELKGRAWVAADSHQVMRMETDLAKPIPEILLQKDHVAIDYSAVEFRRQHLRLWLPETTEIYMDFLGQRSHRRHSFSDFQLFWVDVAEKIGSEPGKAADDPVLVATSFPQSWAPLDVDEMVPPVSRDVSCPLPEVLSGVSTRVKELFENLQQFSATERIDHVEVDKHGKPRSPKSATFTYVAEIHKASPGGLDVNEYRNGSVAQSFPAKLATTGTAAHALIFHPDVVDDFTVTCEGLGKVRGQPAWQLRFVQRPDRPPRFRQYRTPRGWFNVELKGRAWVAADSLQVMRMETDLAKPIPEILLQKDHVVIDYGAVEFRKHHLQLWLPEMTDIYMDFLGQRSHRRHSFTDFQLFSVDVAQKIADPKAE
jgi:hypothetical protein